MSEENKSDEIKEQSPIEPLDRDPFAGKKEKLNSRIPIPVPMQHVTLEELHAMISDYSLENKLTAAETKKMMENFGHNFMGQWRNNRYASIFEADGEYYAGFKLDGKVTGIRSPKVSPNADGDGRVSGKSAIALVNSTLGVGRGHRVDCYESLIGLELGLFREKDLLALQVKLVEARLELGIETRGAIFSSDDIFLSSIIMDFILSHVVRATVKTTPENRIDVLSRLLKVTSAPAIMTAALATMYPNGYPFVHACMDPKCGYTTINPDPKAESRYPMLNFARLYRANKKKLTRDQIRFTNSVFGAHTEEMVLEKQEKMYADVSTEPLSSGEVAEYRLVLNVPSYAYFKEHTMEWLTSLKLVVTDSLQAADMVSQDEERSRRKDYIDQTLTRLCTLKHAAWVKQIVITTTDSDTDEVRTNYIEGTDDVYEGLEELCKDREITFKALKEIDRIKVDSIMGYTGLPVFKCPDCEKQQFVEGSPHRNLIPINITSYFFSIMGWRTVESMLRQKSSTERL